MAKSETWDEIHTYLQRNLLCNTCQYLVCSVASDMCRHLRLIWNRCGSDISWLVLAIIFVFFIRVILSLFCMLAA
jgi:hypothetical protein